jgi:hypothetical protein
LSNSTQELRSCFLCLIFVPFQPILYFYQLEVLLLCNFTVLYIYALKYHWNVYLFCFVLEGRGSFWKPTCSWSHSYFFTVFDETTSLLPPFIMPPWQLHLHNSIIEIGTTVVKCPPNRTCICKDQTQYFPRPIIKHFPIVRSSFNLNETFENDIKSQVCLPCGDYFIILCNKLWTEYNLFYRKSLLRVQYN